MRCSPTCWPSLNTIFVNPITVSIMKRRSFLKINTAILGGLSLNGFGIQAVNPSFLPLMTFNGCDPDKRLVVIQLNGGNDGLNTIIPLDQLSALSKARPNVGLPENRILKSESDPTLGFHPAMEKIKILHDEGKCAVIHGVSYPMPNFSHFRSTDIWLSGSDSNQNVYSGVLGRYLQSEHPDFPEGYPSPSNPDPLAIQIGSTSSLLLQGEPYQMGLSIANANSFYQLVDGEVDDAPNTKAGNELTYIRFVAQQTSGYTQRIKEVAEGADNQSALYPTTPLAEQLKIVAKLIAGGLQTKVYLVSLGGFDTHADQVDIADKTRGRHADLLQNLADSVYAFMDDLRLLGREDQVLTMTLSEFGRRIASNSSNGTDHGAAAPQFVFGPGITHNVINEHPLIPDEVAPGDSLEMKTDFRSVYATILQKWFCVPENDSAQIMLKPFGILPIFDDVNTAVIPEVAAPERAWVFPNPCHEETTVHFSSQGEKIGFALLAPTGRQLLEIKPQYFPGGSHQYTVQVGNLPSGVYYLQVIGERTRQTIGFMKDH
jgi:uncharacterized protein (DUF1501 family)